MTVHLAICYFLLASHWNRASIFNRFQGICIEICLGHDLDPSASQRHVTLAVTWPFDTHVPFPIRVLLNRLRIYSHFRDNGPQEYWGHDRDLSRSLSPYAISCWCPIGTESLSSTMFEISAYKYIWVRVRPWPFRVVWVTTTQCMERNHTQLNSAQSQLSAVVVSMALHW